MISFYMRTSQDFLKVGTAIIFVGFTILVVGVILTIIDHPATIIDHPASSQMGGLIMIGPIPIVFGSSPEITTNMLGLGLIISLLYLLFLWKTKH